MRLKLWLAALAAALLLIPGLVSAKTVKKTYVKPTAICRDHTYSYSQNHRGTCSGHGGVSIWLK